MRLPLISKISRRLLNFIITALAIAGVFHIGLTLSIISLPQNKEVISVKNFSASILKTASEGMELKTRTQTFKVSPEELQKWIEPYQRDYSGETDFRLNSMMTDYLNTLSPLINIEPVNAKFTFANNRAQVFVPSSSGKKLNLEKSIVSVGTVVLENGPSAELAVEIVEPEITLDKINNLGISTLLGRGESDYGHSSAARIHNIKIGMSKFNGVILKPGAEFSFNNLLGPVEEREGYQAELVIKNGGLVREFGGGLCQVATTVFRSAILSGLEIKERKPHSFPVQYYNPQGFDATIYPGIVDLRFINNTESHALIQTRLIGSRLRVEVYGSNPGKEVAMEGPFQYDQKANGSMRAYFIRKIYTDGKLEKEERFDSVYKPPPPHPLERNPLE